MERSPLKHHLLPPQEEEGQPQGGVSDAGVAGFPSQRGKGRVGSRFLPAVVHGATESGFRAN